MPDEKLTKSYLKFPVRHESRRRFNEHGSINFPDTLSVYNLFRIQAISVIFSTIRFRRLYLFRMELSIRTYRYVLVNNILSPDGSVLHFFRMTISG